MNSAEQFPYEAKYLSRSASQYMCEWECESVLHVQALLGFGGLILGAVAYHSITVRQVEVECDQRAVLHAQRPQGRAINLGNKETYDEHTWTNIKESRELTFCDLTSCAKK